MVGTELLHHIQRSPDDPFLILLHKTPLICLFLFESGYTITAQHRIVKVLNRYGILKKRQLYRSRLFSLYNPAKRVNDAFCRIVVYPQNAVPCILTPSHWLGGQPHLLFCLPLLNGGLTYYRNIRIPFKVL